MSCEPDVKPLLSPGSENNFKLKKLAFEDQGEHARKKTKFRLVKISAHDVLLWQFENKPVASIILTMFVPKGENSSGNNFGKLKQFCCGQPILDI